MINPDLERAIQASLKQEIADQDEFDSVMAWLGKMVSACNFMEQAFLAFLVRLLQCRQAEMALIVGRERRSFWAMVNLIEELFAVYAQEQSARDEFHAVRKIAEGLYEERNKYVHSVWYLLPSELTNTTPAHRYKDKKNAEPIGVVASLDCPHQAGVCAFIDFFKSLQRCRAPRLPTGAGSCWDSCGFATLSADVFSFLDF